MSQTIEISASANCGHIDLVSSAYILNNASGFATVTLLGTTSLDKMGLASAISTATGALAATTGGFSVYATRVAGTSQKASVTAWINELRAVS